MAKDKSINPAAAHHKSEKAKALKKNKAQVAASRQQKLAGRNPVRLERDIAVLKDRGHALSKQESIRLADLEKTLGLVQKAREKVGVPEHQQQGKRQPRDGEGSVLGKRGRDGDRQKHQHQRQERSRTPEELRYIPWPRDESPPVPAEFLARYNIPKDRKGEDEVEGRHPHALPSKPEVAAAATQTTYSSAPQIRDLRKEATRFVPGVVRGKVKAARGEGGTLIEEDEREKLEREGYFGKVEGRRDEADALEEEEKKFRMELEGADQEPDEARAGRSLQARVEEASDEDD